MKQKNPQIIPIHRMDVQTPLGIKFSYMEVGNEYDEIMIGSHKNMIHRDDYYLFMFMDAAEAVFTIDFEEMASKWKHCVICSSGSGTCCVLNQGSKRLVFSH